MSWGMELDAFPGCRGYPWHHKPPADSGSLLADSSRSGCFPFPLQVCWCMQRLQLAEKMMREALSLLRRNFPETFLGAFVKAQVEKLPCVAYVRAACLLQKGR